MENENGESSKRNRSLVNGFGEFSGGLCGSVYRFGKCYLEASTSSREHGENRKLYGLCGDMAVRSDSWNYGSIAGIPVSFYFLFKGISYLSDEWSSGNYTPSIITGGVLVATNLGSWIRERRLRRSKATNAVEVIASMEKELFSYQYQLPDKKDGLGDAVSG